MHQRSGLKKKSLQRMADRAYDRGTLRAELKGEIRPDAMDAKMLYADFCGKTEELSAMQKAAEEALAEDLPGDAPSEETQEMPSGGER